MSILASLIAAGAGAGLSGIFSNNQDQGNSGEGDLRDPKTIAGFALSMLNTAAGRKAWREMTARADQQYADSLAVSTRVGPEGLATYDDSSRRGLDTLFNLTDRQNQGYHDRYSAAEQDIEGYGKQQAEDIDTASRRDAAKAELSLRESGLYGEAVAPDFMFAVERERSAEQRRLGEDLVRQRVNLLSGLSGDALRAEQQNVGNVANWYGNDATNRANLTTGGLNAVQNSIQSLNLVPPPASGLNFQLGSNSGGSPQPPGAGSYVAGPLSQGVGNAAGAAFNQWLNPPSTQQQPYPPLQPTYDNSWMTGPGQYYGGTQYPGGWGPPSY